MWYFHPLCGRGANLPQIAFCYLPKYDKIFLLPTTLSFEFIIIIPENLKFIGLPRTVSKF